ncbi:hypothetical protein D3C72_2368980 [compost metagenome]
MKVQIDDMINEIKNGKKFTNTTMTVYYNKKKNIFEGQSIFSGRLFPFDEVEIKTLVKTSLEDGTATIR